MPDVWLEHNQQQFHVTVGTAAHDRLLEEHAVEIDDPTAAKPTKASKDEPADK